MLRWLGPVWVPDVLRSAVQAEPGVEAEAARGAEELVQRERW